MPHSEISKEDLIALAIQYRDDMRHPPSAESRKRRLAWIEAVIRSENSEVDTDEAAKEGREAAAKQDRRDLPMTSSEGKELVQANASTTEAPEKVTVRSEWRPIESAPKDGTCIQAIIPGHGSNNIIAWHGGLVNSSDEDCCGWHYIEDCEPPASWTDGICWEVNGDGEKSVEPTNWKPLPLAPDSSLNFSNKAVSDAVQLNQTFLPSSSDTEVGDK